ncbi:YcaO-like family protein [Sorangium sp. So ce291]|uniref:YcaO-like family protein n=1 Tax=Sorangium sp. So ce291 TaxID=3133294 RepID=UPI003F5E65D7
MASPCTQRRSRPHPFGLLRYTSSRCDPASSTYALSRRRGVRRKAGRCRRYRPPRCRPAPCQDRDRRPDYARLGWAVWVLDLTHDLGIPTCVALAHQAREGRFTIGFGCHLDPRLAVQRSLTELNQLFDPGGARRAPWDLERLPDRAYLFPSPDLPRVAAQRLPRIGGADLRADIEQCLGRLDEAGLELGAVDKTRPDIGLPVVQVIVPGLRHFWPRFGPGRLYQVPCALGWLPRPLEEGELNPVPLFV